MHDASALAITAVVILALAACMRWAVIPVSLAYELGRRVERARPRRRHRSAPRATTATRHREYTPAHRA